LLCSLEHSSGNRKAVKELFQAAMKRLHSADSRTNNGRAMWAIICSDQKSETLPPMAGRSKQLG
jgi:hypothetical protein